MIITIARQCGCGALHIGEQLSQHYGIPFYTRKNLLELAQKRGVLQEMDDFSVFHKGSFNGRVKAIEAENNMTTEEAIAFVNELDESRVRYHKYYTGMKWGDANDYDLCFDSIRLGTNNSADFIEKYIEEIKLK